MLWRLIDMVLRSRLTHPFWVILNLSDVLLARKRLLASGMEVPFRPHFEFTGQPSKGRVLITDEFVMPCCDVELGLGRDLASDPWLTLVSLLHERSPRTGAFIDSLVEDPLLLEWTHDYAERRIARIMPLLSANPSSFAILVELTQDGKVRVFDGHHRFRITELAGLTTVKCRVIVRCPSVDFNRPHLRLLDKLFPK
jgi:hypothetical protein